MPENRRREAFPGSADTGGGHHEVGRREAGDHGDTSGAGDGRPFVHRLRVRYQETDQMGVVHHANYVTWFEEARTAWIRSLGYSYRRLEEEGLRLPVLEIAAQYGSPAKYEDEVDVEVRLTACTPVRIGFSYTVRRVPDGRVLASGESRHAWVDPDFKPVRLDRAKPDLYRLLSSRVPAASG